MLLREVLLRRKPLWQFLCLLFVFVCSGCSKDDGEESTLVVTPTSLTLSAEGESQNISINSNTSWTVLGNPSWLTVSQSAGEGSASVILTAQKNEKLEARNCTVTVGTKDGQLSQTVTITQNAAAATLTVNVNEVNFSEDAKDIQEFIIQSNTSWTISDKPSWLDISTTNGNGNTTVKLTTNSFNNSSSNRSATLKVSTGAVSQNVTVVQKAGLAAQCKVKPNVIVCLSKSIGFDYTYEQNVSYYYVYYLLASEVGRYTDKEIIELLKKDGKRDIPADDYVSSISKLSPRTNYFIYTVGFDKDGNQGDLVKTEVITKSDTNQPFAAISNVYYNSTEWMWNTTIGPYCKRYYMWSMSGNNLPYYDYTDAIVAWFFNNKLNRYPDNFNPIIQDGSWTLDRVTSDKYLQIVTWGTNESGDFAGIIDNGCYHVTNSKSATSTAEKVSVLTASSKSTITTVKIDELMKNGKVYQLK